MKTKIAFLVIGAFMLLSTVCTAQVEPFTRTYDLYPDWLGEFLMAMEKTQDDGYIVAYMQNEWFDVRTSILKLDKYGEVEWHRVLDETEFPQAHVYSVCTDLNNNYYIAGYFHKSYFPTLWVDQNGFVAKYNCDGDYIWGKTYGSMPHHETDSSFAGESVYDIISYDSNMLIVAGQENYCPGNKLIIFGRPWIFAIDTTGNILWDWNDCTDTVDWFGNFYGITKMDNGNIVAVGNQSRQRVLGNPDSPSDYLGFICVFDINGVLQKRMTWHFLKNVSVFYDVEAVNNNDFAVIAYTADTSVYTESRKERLSLFIFNQDLNEKFQYNINVGGQGGQAKLSIDKDTNIFIVGITAPSLLHSKPGNRNSMLIAKFNKNAELIWKKFVGEEDSNFSLSQFNVVADNDGGASFCSDCAILNTNNFGSYLYKVNELGEGDFEISNLQYPDDDEYIIHNSVQNYKYDEIQIYPNPATNELVISVLYNNLGSKLSLVNLSGRTVLATKLFNFVNNVNIELVPNGIYILKLEKEEKYIYRKIIICK